MNSNNYELAALWIREANSILITAGAGIGVDSGLPDFRGDKGLWKHYPALGKKSLGFTDMANPESFIQKPSLAWGFYGHRLKLYRETEAHDGFKILRKWTESKLDGAFVFTSNVDGHFQKSGFKSENIYECHGSIHQLQCLDGCSMFWSADGFEPIVDEVNCTLISDFPRCPVCGGLARPNILMFGDFNWVDDLYERQFNRYQSWLKQASNLVVIEIGAGSSIPTVRIESEKRAGRYLIRINPRESEVKNSRGLSFSVKGLKALKKIDEHLSDL